MDNDNALRVRAHHLHVPLRWIGTKDTIPKPPWKKGGYIINLQDNATSDGKINPGTHWTAMHVDEDGIVYSDSFGFHPPADLEVLLGKHRYIFTHRQIQDEHTGHCGKYALYFLYFMSKPRGDMSLRDRVQQFLNLWSKEPRDNLRRLNLYLDAALHHQDHADHGAKQE